MSNLQPLMAEHSAVRQVPRCVISGMDGFIYLSPFIGPRPHPIFFVWQCGSQALLIADKQLLLFGPPPCFSLPDCPSDSVSEREWELDARNGQLFLADK